VFSIFFASCLLACSICTACLTPLLSACNLAYLFFRLLYPVIIVDVGPMPLFVAALNLLLHALGVPISALCMAWGTALPQLKPTVVVSIHIRPCMFTRTCTNTDKLRVHVYATHTHKIRFVSHLLTHSFTHPLLPEHRCSHLNSLSRSHNLACSHMRPLS